MLRPSDRDRFGRPQGKRDRDLLEPNLPSNLKPQALKSMMLAANPFVGTWTYRSLYNNPDLSVAYNDLKLAFATLTLEESADIGQLSGTLASDRWQLQVSASYTFGNPFTIRFQATGDVGIETYVYDYAGYLIPAIPEADQQRWTIAGTLVRVVPHQTEDGVAAAGETHTFIAIKQD